MKDQLKKFMADEGLSADSINKFEKIYDNELQGAATLEIAKAIKDREAAANQKIDIAKIAEESRIRR